jgi:CRP-like cAMP-binding protein
MSPLLSALEDLPVQDLPADALVIDQGECTGRLYVLVDGSVAVTKDGVAVTKVSDPGAVFGELSALLEVPHTAAVRTLTPSRFYVVPDAREFLEHHPAVNLHLCRLLARRLDSVNKYLVDLKQQFAGHDHLGMVDGMLDLLMHRQPRARVAPARSARLDPELPE